MATITMQGIASLANVKRPVVSMWRTRFATSDLPFPAPVNEEPLLFDADEVGQWLRETGRGNNPQAYLETALHSSESEQFGHELNTTSTLLLLSELSGAPIQDIDLDTAFKVARSFGLPDVLSEEHVEEALTAPALCAATDNLVEAAFSGRNALQVLYEKELQTNPRADELAFTAPGSEFIAAALKESVGGPDAFLLPHSTLALLFITAVTELSDEGWAAKVVFDPNLTDPIDMLAWRRLAAAGALVSASPVHAGAITHLYATLETDEALVFEQIEDLLQDLGVVDQLLVFAPETLLIGEEAAFSRRALLAPHPNVREHLRYVAELPRGLSRRQPRLRLGVWAFGAREAQLTVASSLAKLQPNAQHGQVLGADLAAALLGDPGITAHAFTSAAIRATDRLVQRDSLALTPDLFPPVDGGERLARIWELDEGKTITRGLSAVPPSRATIPLREALAMRVLRELSGFNIPDTEIVDPAPGHVAVINTQTLDGTSTLGTQTIGRLRLEQIAPHATLTEPGDIVYHPKYGAYLDVEGGHLPVAPTRILRCTASEDHPRILVPEIVRFDVNEQLHLDKGAWQLRAVEPANASDVAHVAQMLRERRSDLEQQLANLGDIEVEVLNGLADGALKVDLEDRSIMKGA